MVLKKPLTVITEEEYDRMFAVNSKYTGLYSSYAGSKAPVEHFTRALSKALSGRHVSVNDIAPAPMDTSFFYPAEDDDSVGLAPRAVPFRKAALQRIEQEIAERREGADGEHQQRCHHDPSAGARKSRG